MIYFKPNIFILCAEKQICEKEAGILTESIKTFVEMRFGKLTTRMVNDCLHIIEPLYWDGDGFLLCYKRIENGKLKWPRTKDEVRTLTNQQVRWLLEGLSIENFALITD
ncbi:hypothetical protein EfmAA818_09650 [Enterococcus faecium]|nr:hypothetical protein EfmAA818_09650 [Enterococcus faecium]